MDKLIYFFEKACAISGYLLEVNPFDQPGVESYKKNMFALLGKKGYEELSKELNVLPEIQAAAPTDGLWDGERTDEQQIGATYPELEWAMAQHAAGKKRGQFYGREQEVFDIFVRLNSATQHKIQPIPICLIPKEFL